MKLYKRAILHPIMCASMASAHVILTSPEPYGKITLNNSPLAANGSDFPCKLRPSGFDMPSVVTVIGVGESHKLTFQGSVMHGGGSCQISLTTDLQPSKTSEWKVIKSIQGGCPANISGNFLSNPNLTDPFSFNFMIPTGIAAGKYTLGWTWFNRLGNREMYMNCAPITVTSESSQKSLKDKDSVSTFPPLFVANINGCMTKEGVDIRFPQPGEVVEYDGSPSNLAPKDSAACSRTPSFGRKGDTTSTVTASSSGI